MSPPSVPFNTFNLSGVATGRGRAIGPLTVLEQRPRVAWTSTRRSNPTTGASVRAPSWTLRRTLRGPLVERLGGGQGWSSPFPGIQHDVVPPVLSGCTLQPVEPPARLRECRIMVPSFPIGLGPPRAHNYSPVLLVCWPEELSSDPTRPLPRGLQAPPHDGVPVSSGVWPQVHMRHDRFHREALLPWQ